MSIPTQMSLAKFVAPIPMQDLPNDGVERYHTGANVGRQRKEHDGGGKRLTQVFHDMIAFERKAHDAFAWDHRVDSVAAGYAVSF
jgi:hypothetical protein